MAESSLRVVDSTAELDSLLFKSNEYSHNIDRVPLRQSARTIPPSSAEWQPTVWPSACDATRRTRRRSHVAMPPAYAASVSERTSASKRDKYFLEVQQAADGEPAEHTDDV